MALGDKHAKLSFSGWPWAPDARKRDNLEAPVAPRHGGIPLFASPALLIQENLDLLMAIKSRGTKRRSITYAKDCQKQNRNRKKRRLSRMLLGSPIFDVFWTDFDAKGTRNVHDIMRKTQQF